VADVDVGRRTGVLPHAVRTKSIILIINDLDASMARGGSVAGVQNWARLCVCRRWGAWREPHSTATVTVFDGEPCIKIITGAALVAPIPAGTRAFTWYSPT